MSNWPFCYKMSNLLNICITKLLTGKNKNSSFSELLHLGLCECNS